MLYHNNGDGTFTNVTKAAGIYQPEGMNLSVAAADYDDDGWPDLFVANDGVECLPLPQRITTELSPKSALRVRHGPDVGRGKTMAAMCMSLGDYDNDGHLDLYISDFQGAFDHIWHYDGKGVSTKSATTPGSLCPPNVLSFGGGFFDYDNDGWLDLFIANGHVYPGNRHSPREIRYKEINSLFHNDRNGKFVEVSKYLRRRISEPYVGRGAAFADFDNDGNVDVVVANNGDPPLLLHNDGRHRCAAEPLCEFQTGGNQEQPRRHGRPHDGAGGKLSQVREIDGGGSYLSQSDLRAHFGLGQHGAADLVEVRWPGGLRQTFHNVKGDKFYLIVEGKDQLQLQRTPLDTKPTAGR